MKKVRASLSVHVSVDCPHCMYGIDLLIPRDTGGIDLDSEGDVTSQAFPDTVPSDKARDTFNIPEVICSSCKKIFGVQGLDW